MVGQQLQRLHGALASPDVPSVSRVLLSQKARRHLRPAAINLPPRATLKRSEKDWTPYSFAARCAKQSDAKRSNTEVDRALRFNDHNALTPSMHGVALRAGPKEQLNTSLLQRQTQHSRTPPARSRVDLDALQVTTVPVRRHSCGLWQIQSALTIARAANRI